MRFKVGDKVRVREWEDLCSHYPAYNGGLKVGIYFNKSMREMCGKVATVVAVHGDKYHLHDSAWTWVDEMFENDVVDKTSEEEQQVRIVPLSEVPNGSTFSIDDIKMCKIYKEGDGYLCMYKAPVFRCPFGETQNYAKSDVHARLTTETLPALEEKVGAENLLEFTLDLQHHNEKNKYLDIVTKIGIPTYYIAEKHSRISNIASENDATYATAYDEDYVLTPGWFGVTTRNIASNGNIVPIVCLAENTEVSYGGQ